MAGLGERRVAVVIDDDPVARELLVTLLTQAGFETFTATDGPEGITAVRRHDPVVTTLDISMPGIDGFETTKRIREFSTTYILMVSVRDEEIDMMQGLDAGADDYVTKPFRPREVRARIDAMMRRSRSRAGGTPVTARPSPSPAHADLPVHGDPPDRADPPEHDGPRPRWLAHNGLRVQVDMRYAELDGEPLTLTRSEFDILAALMSSARRVLSKASLARAVHSTDYLANEQVSAADSRAVEVHVGNLRRKLGDSSTAPQWIETVRGVGYRLAVARPMDRLGSHSQS